MEQETPAGFEWRDWDWRPLARLAAWVLLAAAWSRFAHAEPLACAGRALRQLFLLWLLTCGLLTHLLAIAAMGSLRLALTLDEAAYVLSERLVRPFVGRAPFAATFVAAFGAELALVLGAVRLWRAADMGGRISVLLAEALR